MRNTIFFISDLHLGSRELELERIKKRKFLAFLKQIENEAEHLYIVGDLFDFWFEYHHAIPKVDLDILTGLKNLTDAGVKLTLFYGNHDCWQIDYLARQLPARLVMWDLSVEHQSKKIYICHGDGLAASDKGYLILKKVLRNRVNVQFYRLLPADWALPLAKWVSGHSRDYTTRRGKNFLAEYEAFAQQKLGQGYDIVIVGHSHYPEEKDFAEKKYVNLGDWITNFTFARLRNGRISLANFD